MEVKFGSAGSVFRTGNYFVPPLLARPIDADLSDTNDGRPNAEFPAWKRSVCLQVEARFGSAGSVSRTGKYYVPPLLA